MNVHISSGSASQHRPATISLEIAINDLKGRTDPKTHPWKETISYIRARAGFAGIIGTLIVTTPFAVLTAYGLHNPILLKEWLWLFPISAISYFPLARLLYYNSIKPKKAGSLGITLGKSYKHYIEMHHAADAADPAQTSPATKAIYVGENRIYKIDYMTEANPHVIIIGSSGSGKTQTLRAFIVRNSLAHKVPFLIIDWNGEQEEWSKEVGATLWKVPKNMKINPFALRGMTPAQRASAITDLFHFGAGLTQLQTERLRKIAYAKYTKGEKLKLLDVWKIVNERMQDRKQTPDERQYAAWIEQRLRTTQQVIGEEPEEFWESLLERNTVISLAGLGETEKSLVAYAIFQRIYEMFNRTPELQQRLRLMLVLDEAWKILQKSPDTKELPLPVQIVRLGRKYGFGILVATQQISDLSADFINSSAVRIIHNYTSAEGHASPEEIFKLGIFESSYLGTADKGECLVSDRTRKQSGQEWLDYVKVDMLTSEELAEMKAQYPSSTPKTISEGELPIDDFEVGKTGKSLIRQQSKTMPLQAPIERPTATMHATLLVIQENKGVTKAELVKALKSTGFITSDPTIYGAKGRPGVFDTAESLGYAKKAGKGYELTDAGAKWVDPKIIIKNEKNLGGDLHIQLMIKTIEELHKANMLVIAPSENEAPDLIAYPVDAKKKFLWDDTKRKCYEIQTTARKDSITENVSKKEKYMIPITWVTYDKDVLEEIKRLTDNKDDYVLTKV